MRTQTIAIAIAGLSFTVAAEAQDKPVQVFTAVGPWAMEYADDSCRLARNLTDGQKEATLALERYTPGGQITIGIAGDSIRAFRNARETTVSFAPEGAQDQSRPLFRSTLSDGRTAFLIPDASLTQPPDWSEFSPEEIKAMIAKPIVRQEEIELAKGVSAIKLDHGFLTAVEMQSGSLSGPIKAMHNCIDDLLRHWGLDPEVQHSLSRRAAPSDGKDLARSFSYPLQPLMLGQSGSVRVRLIVAPDGHATECHLTGPSAQQDFINESCRKLTAEAVFDPALDAEGNPVQSYYATTIHFYIN